MLTSVMGNQRKTAEYVEECRRMGIDVLPPDVNESSGRSPPSARWKGTAPGKRIRFGLAAVKNVGTQAIEAILQETEATALRRSGRPLPAGRSARLQQAGHRIPDPGRRPGSLPGHRALQLAMLDEAIERGSAFQQLRSEDQLDLFEGRDAHPFLSPF